METINAILLLASALLFVSVLASKLSARLGFPLLLVFIILGLLVGEDGPGGIIFDDYKTSFLVGNLALAIILLDGGLRTEFKTFRLALYPALSLATAGVFITAGLMGVFCVYLLGFDWKYGLLLGAIVGSTDAAAVFSVLQQKSIQLDNRIKATLEIESGLNDPMAVFLVITLVEWLRLTQTPTATHLGLIFLGHFAVGAVVGIGGSLLLTQLLNKIRLSEELAVLFIISGGIALFAITNLLNGSGFMAIYVAGLLIGNSRNKAKKEVLKMMDSFAWLSQAGMFLVLGLLVTPSKLWTDISFAVATAVFLMLIARPVAVWLSLIPFRFSAKEMGFIGWVGLRGAVPIILAVFPIMSGLKYSQLFFHVAFVVVLMSLLIQGTTISWIARLCNVGVATKKEDES